MIVSWQCAMSLHENKHSSSLLQDSVLILHDLNIFIFITILYNVKNDSMMPNTFDLAIHVWNFCSLCSNDSTMFSETNTASMPGFLCLCFNFKTLNWNDVWCQHHIILVSFRFLLLMNPNKGAKRKKCGLQPSQEICLLPMLSETALFSCKHLWTDRSHAFSQWTCII